MRKNIVAGNWKMNTTVPEGIELAKAVVAKASEVPSSVSLIIAPPFTHLCPVAEVVKGSSVGLSAQNCADKVSGAYTGEVSVKMLASAGCGYVILGHSERRQYYGETDEIINSKVLLALSLKMEVVLCVGETLEEREGGKLEEVLERQIRVGLKDVLPAEMEKITIAYEPVWAIGTGKTATPEDADAAHAYIRRCAAALYSEDIANNLIIQYGGSVKPGNVRALMEKENIDGALVGGASLKLDDFLPIITYNK